MIKVFFSCDTWSWSFFTQLFSGLPATLAEPMIRPSAAGHRRTRDLGGRSSPAARLPSTSDPTWTTQVSTSDDRLTISDTVHVAFYLCVADTRALHYRWTGEFHLHLSNQPPRDRGGSTRQPRGRLPGLGPLCVVLVPHVWATHRHTTHQAAQANGEGTCRCPTVDSQRTPRTPLEGRSCPRATHQQALSGNWPTF